MGWFSKAFKSITRPFRSVTSALTGGLIGYKKKSNSAEREMEAKTHQMEQDNQQMQNRMRQNNADSAALAEQRDKDPVGSATVLTGADGLVPGGRKLNKKKTLG
jgi:hypothetical protein